MNILAGNRLIAEFMGGHYQVHPMNHLGNENEYVFHKSPCEYFSATQFAEDRMHYHHYWDWLMPVVEKIELLGYDSRITGNNSDGGFLCDFVGVDNSEYACKCSYNNKIDAVWMAVVEFIEWHNKQKESN